MHNPINSLEKIYSGKVRDLYKIDDKSMLMVASDRLSTFDIILNQPITNKGKYLTKMSLFWFDKLKHIIPNHLIYNIDIKTILSADELDYALDRSIIVKQLQPVPVEVIVRGFLAGSGYKDYLETGEISGIKLPHGLQNGEKLAQPIFTPSTKAKVGVHDENITLKECENLIGVNLTNQISDIAIKLYKEASEYAIEKGIIIADTKFEFGLDENNQLTLMDEILTPDSSRFWEVSTYKIGINPPSFDKQFVRDYLECEIKWNKSPPVPDLPESVLNATQNKYIEIMERITNE